MRRTALALILLVAFGGCRKPASSDARLAAAPNNEPMAAAAEAASDAAAGAPSATAATPQTPAGTPMLAYDYSASLTVPDGRVYGLMVRHQQACAAAGARVCQMLQSRVSTSRGITDGMLKLRAEPRWLARFRGGLNQDAKGVGGSLTSSSVDSEDLTRAIVDTEASLRAKTTLRARLEKLLAEHPGKMSDLLEIEKQLADTQGEIDAAQSELAVMRARVDMSTMTLSYGSHPDAIASGRARPLAEAMGNFGTVVSLAASVIVYAVAFLIPFAVIVVPLVWLWLRRRARKKAERAA